MVGCASTDPISRFIAKPPEVSTKLYTAALPPTATPEEVVRAFLAPDWKYQMLEVRTVLLSSGRPHTIVLASIDGLGKKILSLYYYGEDRGGWWIHMYGAN